MLSHYLRIAYRYLFKHRAYAFINVAGLAVGMAACILILLYVQDELGYDAYHAHADRIYRVTREQLNEDGSPDVENLFLDPAVAVLLKQDFPEVVEAARLTPVSPLLSYEDRHLAAERTYWADPGLFDVLTIPLLQGDPETALADPFSLVLSASTAKALFQDRDPLDQTVVVNNGEAFKVTGVFRDLPHNTHLHADALGSLSSLARWFGTDALLQWDSPNYATYLLLAEDADPDRLEQKLPGFLEAHLGAEARRLTRLHLQPVPDIHLRSHLASELEPTGDVAAVYLFSAIAAFILLIACINFVNLSTARSAKRAREVGLRKVVGATRGQLIGQFLGESTLTAGLALALAAVLVEAALPAFSQFTGKDLAFRLDDAGRHLILFAGIGLFAGVVAGSYPAFFLSAFRPAGILSGARHTGRRSAFRSVLVVFQFATSVVLIVGTLTVFDQLAYVRQQKLGFDAEGIVVLPAIREIAGDFEPFRNRLLQHPDIRNVTQSNRVPTDRLLFVHEAEALQGDRPAVGNVFLAWVDAYFFPTYGIEVAAGRTFSPDVAGDAAEAFVLNETAARQFGWADPADAVGAPFTLAERRGHVIGVVRDFHHESLHQAIGPVAFYPVPHNYRAVSVRFRSDDVPALMDYLEDRWQEYHPNRPLDYAFLDARFGALYAAERRLGQLFSVFALLALVITCLGLFGMAAFTAEQRTKEIGIRKTLGASTGSIVLLLSGAFTRLVAVAFVVGAPVAYFLVDRWLDGFAYRVEMSGGTFLMAGLTALVIAWLTVSYQSIRAALADPVKSLRYE